MTWLQLIGGGFLLYLGAEWFVGGASALALALRVPQIIIGLTVVAYGTSTPEIIVGIQAATGGHGDVALGNVIGSNIANIGLILGVAALVRPAKVDGALRTRELPVFAASAAVAPLLLADGTVSRAECFALLGVALAYTLWMLRAARTAALDAVRTATVTRDAADSAGAPRSRSTGRSALIALVGLVVLLLGGQLFVDSAVRVAADLGMSERLVGLTIVAVGTSLPELVTSVVAARGGHSDIAIGNVVGSNIFNTFLCLSAAGLAGPVGAPLSSLRLDLIALGTLTLLAAIFIRSERTITRAEGALALTGYLVFTTLVVLRG